MTRVHLVGSAESFEKALAPYLQARGLALAEAGDLAPGDGDIVILAHLVSALMAQSATAKDWNADQAIAAIEADIAKLSAQRVVLISAAQPEGEPGSFAQGAAVLAGQRIEAALAARLGPKSVVLRVSDILDPDDPELQQTLRAQIDGQHSQWPSADRLQPIGLTDLAAAVAAAAQVPGVLGKWYDIAVPEAIDRYTLVAEAQRLSRLLNDPYQSEIQERPPYPVSEPLRDVSAAAAVLHITPKRSAWVLVAQTVQNMLRQARDSGAIAPLRPPMPAVFRALETGALPLAGRHVLVTGATGGIGRAAVSHLLRLGADVTGIARNEASAGVMATDLAERWPSDARAIGRKSGAEAARCGHPVAAGTPGRFSYLTADLTDLDGLRALAGQICADHPTLDAVIHCAGAIFPERGDTPAGIEKTFALNLLAPLTLTRLLANSLSAAGKAGGARVLTLVSESHADAPIDLTDLQARTSFNAAEALARCQSGLVMMTAALADVMQGTGVSAFCVMLGPVRTNFHAALDEPLTGGPTARQRQQTQRQQARMQMQSPDSAAAHVVDLLLAEEFRTLNGGLIHLDKVVDPAPHTQDRADSEALWQAAARLGGLAP